MAKTKKNKLVNVKVVKNYFDTLQDKLIEPGTEFSCSIERSKELLNAQVVCLKN